MHHKTNLKKYVHVLLRHITLYCGVGVLPHHIINGPHNVSHFLKEEVYCYILCEAQTSDGTLNTASAVPGQPHLSVYVAISVNVVQVKRPLQLFPQSTAQ